MSFDTQPLQDVIPAYLYAQYSDDANMQAFVAAFNGLAQGYLDWFNQNPLGVYTNPNMTGSFLDWIGTELYGIARPVVGSTSTAVTGWYGSVRYASLAYAQVKAAISGSAVAVSDDIYKRYMTWFLYLGDGRQMSIPWLVRRIARFLYGSNGGDITASEFQYVSITQPSAHTYAVTFPTSPAALTFIQLAENGFLSFPFQITFTFEATS